MSESLHSALFWMMLNLLSCLVLAFFSMGEMACVSFNKIRLHYYKSKGIKRAEWLHYLLEKPVRLFGTTLIGVNTAMFIGSECARQTYLALGLNPDWAPLTQVPIVLILAELVPMFAARSYAEHVAMLEVPILYATAKLFTPFLWLISWISQLTDWLSGKNSNEEHIVLNQDDLQKMLDFQQDEPVLESEGEVNTITRNIFTLRNKDAKQIMQPLSNIPTLPSSASVDQLKDLLRRPDINYVPIYHRNLTHIIGVIHPRDFIRSTKNKRLRDYTEAPWFITQNTKVMQILHEFKRNNRQLAIVLNEQGHAIGVISLTNLIQEIFGKTKMARAGSGSGSIIIDRTFPADLLIGDFNTQFDVVLSEESSITLGDLVEKTLGHHPEEGESIFLYPFELTVKEVSLTGIKSIAVTTRRS